MKRVKFVATIYRQETMNFPGEAVLSSEEAERRTIKTRKVSEREMKKVLRLKEKLQKMGSPWERKYKREANDLDADA